MELLIEMEKARELVDAALTFDNIKLAKLIHTRDIIVDERVRYQCAYSGCREYGRKLMCPPYTLSVDEFKKVLSRYYMALLVQLEGEIISKANWEPESDRWALKLHDVVYQLENKAFGLGFPFAAALIGGSCKLCKECAGINSSKPMCIHREKARPSMEAMGVDVLKTCSNIGINIDFSPDKVTWTGFVLLS